MILFYESNVKNVEKIKTKKYIQKEGRGEKCENVNPTKGDRKYFTFSGGETF